MLALIYIFYFFYIAFCQFFIYYLKTIKTSALSVSGPGTKGSSMKNDKKQEAAARREAAWEEYCDELVRRSFRMNAALSTWTRRHEVEQLAGAPEGVTLH